MILALYSKYINRLVIYAEFIIESAINTRDIECVPEERSASIVTVSVSSFLRIYWYFELACCDGE